MVREASSYKGVEKVLESTYYPKFTWHDKRSQSGERHSSLKEGRELDADCKRMFYREDPVTEFGHCAQRAMLIEGWEFTELQLKCFSPSLNLCGYADAVVRNTEGRHFLLDFKTGYPASVIEQTRENLLGAYKDVPSNHLTHCEMQVETYAEILAKTRPTLKIDGVAVVVLSGFDKRTGEVLYKVYWVRPWVFGILKNLAVDQKAIAEARRKEKQLAKDKVKEENKRLRKQVALLKKAMVQKPARTNKKTFSLAGPARKPRKE